MDHLCKMAEADLTSVESKMSALSVEEETPKVEDHSNNCSEEEDDDDDFEICDKQIDTESCSDDDDNPFKDAADPDKQGEATAATDDEYHSADEGEPNVDEELRKEMEAQLTEEEKKSRQEEAQTLKENGNKEFKESNFQEAVSLYTKALLTCPLVFTKDRSIMFSNRAACYMRMSKNKKAIEDSCSALELNPNYLKALIRRAELYEKEDKLDEALEDYKKILEMDPSQHAARAACMRLPSQIEERNEKMKAEMMGKLKDLGNLILKPFGLSTDNFQMQKDPNTGSYSVNFKQNVNAS